MFKFRTLIICLVLTGVVSTAYAVQKFSYIQTNFTAGEMSPKMDGRVDFPKYFNAASELDNFIIYPQGGVVRRSGFEFIASSKVSNEAVRLIPFEFSTEQAYVLELGDQYMRVYKDGGRLVAVDSYAKLLLHGDGNDASTTITDSSTFVHTVTVHGDAQLDVQEYKFGGSSIKFDGNGDYVSAPDSADWYMGTDPCTIDLWVKFDNITSNHAIFENYLDAANYVGLTWDYVSNKLNFNVVDSLVTDPSMSASWSPSANVWYHVAVIRGWGGAANTWALCVNGVAISTLDDTDGRDWPDFGASSVMTFGRSGANGLYLHGWEDEIRVSKGIARWTANFTPPVVEYPQATGGTPYEIATPWHTEDLWDIRYVQSADTMWLVHPDYKPRKLTRTGHTAWTLTNYVPTSDPFTSSTMYPISAAFFEERLCFGGTTASPQNIWLSVSGDFDDMTTGSNDDDAISVAIASDQVNSIRWMEPGRVLIVGTVGGEWRLGGSTLDDPITPGSVTARRETAYGSAPVQAETIGKNVLFVQRAGKKVREFGYNFDVDGYLSHDLNILADSIIGSPIVEVAYQQEPVSILWCVTQDGRLLSLTYHKDHDVIAWSEQPIGGTSAQVKSVVVIPGTEDEEVWISVERTIPDVSNGNRVNYIERMRPIFDDTDTTYGFFVDSGLAYEGGAVSGVSGLEHLRGETVQVLCDGTPIDDETVSESGEISFEHDGTATDCSVAYAGLPYNSNIKTMRLAIPQDQSNTIQGKIKSIDHITLRFLQTKECKMGPDADNLDPIEFDSGTSTFTGDKEWSFNANSNEEQYIYLRQDEPLPLTVLAIIPEVTVGE